jgi:hypothetical protein
LLTPAFHFHSFVLLLPAAVLLMESLRAPARTTADHAFAPIDEREIEVPSPAA